MHESTAELSEFEEPRPPRALDAEMVRALEACAAGGKHLLNALRWLGEDPSSIRTQADALEHEWSSPWAYDVWCAWHACRIALRNAGWDTTEISYDHRHNWRTAAKFPVFGR